MTETTTSKVVHLRPLRVATHHPMGMPAPPPPLPANGPTAAKMAARRALRGTPLVISDYEKANLEQVEADMLLRTFRIEAAYLVKKMLSVDMGTEAVRLFQSIADETRDMVQGNGHA